MFIKVNKLCIKGIEQLNFEEFKKLLQKTWREDDPHELKNAVSVFDPAGNGYLTVQQLKNTMLNLGENLDEEDFKEILKNVNVQPDGTINTDG